MAHGLGLKTSGALGVLVMGALLILGAGEVRAGPTGPTLEPPFDDHYTVTDLGQIDGVPADYGGVAFSQAHGDLLIGGAANEEDGRIYRVGVIRDEQGHITGFESPFAYPEAPYIDGGLAIGPGGVIFYSRYNPPSVEIGQIALSFPASGVLASIVLDLEPLGVADSPGGLNFVPPGFPGAGSLKVTSYSDGDWYEVGLAPANDGTYEATSASLRADLPSGSEGFVFVLPGLPGFGSTHSVLINEYNDSSIAAYELDDNGDPIPDTRRTFLTGISGPDGAAFDPASGDLIISDFDNDRVYRVSGFPAPPSYAKGDNNCDGNVNALDALAGLQFVAGLEPNQQEGCPELGQVTNAVSSGIGPQVFGDIDCDDDVDAVDSLLILRFVAALPVDLPEECPPIEQP